MTQKEKQKRSVLCFNISRFFAILLLLAGCAKEAEKTVRVSEPVLSQQYRKKSATAIVSLSATNIPTSGKILLMLDVHAPETAEVVFPELGNLIEPFTVSDGYTEPVQTLPNGKLLHRRVWALVPRLPGTTVFHPLEITAGTATIITQPIAVSVRSLLPSGIEAFEIMDIAAPADLLPEQQKQRELRLLIAALAGGAVLLIVLVKFCRRTQHEIIIPPHEAALQALESLPEDPLERTQELNRIVVEYVGRRFNLPVEGKTTKEILPLLPHYPLLGRRLVLNRFLKESELFRFSNRIPAGFAAESEAFIRGFVESTKEEPA